MENLKEATLFILTFVFPKTNQLIIQSNKLKLNPIQTILYVIENNRELTLLIALLCIAGAINLFQRIKIK